MNKKCLGCGVVLQFTNDDAIGYINPKTYESSSYCKRCFRIKNYGDYKIVKNESDEYKKLFDLVSLSDDLVIYVQDVLTICSDIEKINKFKNKILVLTKKDLLPKSVKEGKLISYIKNNYNVDLKDVLFVSPNKNYNLDLLKKLIFKYKKSDKVYLVGYTNAGKSTIINSFIKSFSSHDNYVTTSFLPSTTLDFLNVKINDNLTFIDTPGIIDEKNMLTKLDGSKIKKISPKTEIKPRTFQIKPNQSILVDDYARIDYFGKKKNSFTFYLSNELLVKRINMKTNNIHKNLTKYSFDVKEKSDLVINGLLFCKIVSNAKIDVYTNKDVKVWVRKSMI